MPPISKPAIAAHKAQLRREAAARRDALHERPASSAAICQRVIGLPAFQAATAIHCFLPMRSEVDTRPVIAAALATGKAVAVPVVGRDGALTHSWIDTLDPATFTHGQLGTPRPRHLRPAAIGAWSLTLVPLLAFDRAGYRLGYGKGYYDQLLAAAGGMSVGVAFACQELLALPREPHDLPLDCIVTDAEVIIPLRAS